MSPMSRRAWRVHVALRLLLAMVVGTIPPVCAYLLDWGGGAQTVTAVLSTGLAALVGGGFLRYETYLQYETRHEKIRRRLGRKLTKKG